MHSQTMLNMICDCVSHRCESYAVEGDMLIDVAKFEDTTPAVVVSASSRGLKLVLRCNETVASDTDPGHPLQTQLDPLVAAFKFQATLQAVMKLTNEQECPSTNMDALPHLEDAWCYYGRIFDSKLKPNAAGNEARAAHLSAHYREAWGLIDSTSHQVRTVPLPVTRMAAPTALKRNMCLQLLLGDIPWPSEHRPTASLPLSLSSVVEHVFGSNVPELQQQTRMQACFVHTLPYDSV